MQTIPVFCGKDCGGNACPLMATIGNGHVNRIFHNPAGGKYLKGCSRDFNLPWDLYAPGRILKPLMQVGERGSGRFRQYVHGHTGTAPGIVCIMHGMGVDVRLDGIPGTPLHMNA